MTFEQLGLIDPLLKALKTEGYTTPTPIQEQSIPVVLEGKDLLGCAQTGTGKTAAFALPMLQILHNDGRNAKGFKHIRALILTPTRELAMQIEEQCKKFASACQISCLAVYGGVPKNVQ